jgi:hypothetical protein
MRKGFWDSDYARVREERFTAGVGLAGRRLSVKGDGILFIYLFFSSGAVRE